MPPSDKTSDNKQPAATLADAAQVANASGKEPLKVEAKEYPAVARVRAAGTRNSVHLITNEVIPCDSDKKIDIDGYARAQLDAGKWVIAD